ncbi:Polycomb group protein EMBRYONIC FLOWER 2 [Glycine max]|nr:Polycomb group protein EMBRYONIC FLOWER 2 [Glycine max]
MQDGIPLSVFFILCLTAGEYCLCGKVSLESLYMAWDCFPNFRLGQRAEIMSTVDLLPCILKSDFPNDDTRISIQVPSNFENMSTSKQVQITISAEEFGAKEKSPYLSYAGSEVPSSSLSHMIGYYNNKLQRTEVTEDFTCPFCLVKCACFKVSDECHAVNVSVKNDISRSEIFHHRPLPWATGASSASFLVRPPPSGSKYSDLPVLEVTVLASHPRAWFYMRQATSFVGASWRRIRSSFRLLFLVTDSPDRGTQSPVGISATIIRSRPDRDSVQSMSDCDQAVLQFAKTRKLSIERPDPRKIVFSNKSFNSQKLMEDPLFFCWTWLKNMEKGFDIPFHSWSSNIRAGSTFLRKRQFFHSHKAQPMAIEQVLSDKDSEDEVDDDVADFEDRRMLENVVDVSNDEKTFMHMWNSFVRKHRVIADGHISWACEAFSKLHAPEFVQSPSLAGCWRIFMVKLYNHGLLDARTMNDCNIILEQYQRQNSDPKS